MLAFTLLASTLLMGSEGESGRHKKHAAKPKGPTVEEQLQQLKDQLNQQQDQIKQQQDHIQTLEQQLQQNNAKVEQQNQQLQNSVQAADQKATAAQDSANSLNSNVTEVKVATDSVSKKVEEDQKTIDRLANPDKYLPQPTVVQAVAPVRLLPIDPPVKNGLVPAFRIAGVHVTPYGFLKSTAAEDSSNPHGDDFPLPGFIAGLTNTFGPTMDPAFHLKARSSRFGANFEFPDMSRRLILTGRVEADFEGNFSRADNRNVSTYRSSMLSLRMAYARLDYAATENTDIFFEGGQDWTIYGSSLLGNILETTFLGAYFGQSYERAPQMRLGFTQKLGGSRNLKFSPEVAIMMPLEGLVPAAATGSLNADSGAALGNQLGYGERQGQDANRPELETRAVLQFQLDKAPGVASAQLIASAFKSTREAIILPGEVPALFAGSFPRGATTRSSGYGIQIGAQLPTRWVTITGSIYHGADLRFMFAGQLTSIYNNTFGLTGLASAPSIDGATTQFFGINSSGVAVLAPQRAVRGYGGLVNVGLPLSRWFNANPRGHNAGWQLLFHAGLDAANADDFRHLHNIWAPGTTLPGADAAVAAGPQKSTMGAATLYYKFNQFCTLAYEQSLYSSYAIKNFNGTYVGAATGALAGQREWRDRREEFGPIFTF
jgi:hypothetical protein